MLTGCVKNAGSEKEQTLLSQLNSIKEWISLVELDNYQEQMDLEWLQGDEVVQAFARITANLIDAPIPQITMYKDFIKLVDSGMLGASDVRGLRADLLLIDDAKNYAKDLQ